MMMTMMRMHPFLSASTTARGRDACRGGGCRERGSADLASKYYTDFQVAYISISKMVGLTKKYFSTLGSYKTILIL